MSKSVTGETAWKPKPILAGLTAYEAEVALREKPGASYPPVGTKATAAVIIEERKVNGRIRDVADLEAAISEGKKRCEEIIQKGRPR